MTTPIRPTGKTEIYPGQYNPRLKEDEVLKDMKPYFFQTQTFPQVTMTDNGKEYKIELPFPGMKREDFLVHADENILSIIMLHQEAVIMEKWGLRLPETSNTCLERRVPLPNDADISFTCAEYRNGILCITISKSCKYPAEQHTQLVVY